jgi:hypothetical protein
VGDGFRIANKHFPQILGYALLSATVGIILRQIAQRGVVGRLVASFFGVAWNIATFLAVPVLIMEGVGPIDAVKRSTQLLKKTWGEQIAGNLGIGAAFGLMSFALVVILGGGVALAISSQTPALIVGAVVLFVASLMALGVIGSTLSAIYTAAVYRYAVHGDGGGAFDPALVSGAFRTK